MTTITTTTSFTTSVITSDTATPTVFATAIVMTIATAITIAIFTAGTSFDRSEEARLLASCLAGITMGAVRYDVAAAGRRGFALIVLRATEQRLSSVADLGRLIKAARLCRGLGGLRKRLCIPYIGIDIYLIPAHAHTGPHTKSRW